MKWVLARRPLPKNSIFTTVFKTTAPIIQISCMFLWFEAALSVRKKGEQSDYRLNLNLYSYQIRTALDTDVKQTLKIKDSKTFYPQAIVLAEQTSALLKKT